jgi:acyl-CoA thioester hydrolase
MEPMEAPARVQSEAAARGAVDTAVRVRYAETDQMGVVYYANYMVWMEVGRVELCRNLGIRYRDMEIEDGVLLVVAEANCRYGAPARYDDEVRIRSRIARATPRMIRFEYEFFDTTAGILLAAGFTKHVFCGRDLKPRKLPEKYWRQFGIAARGADSDS